MLSIRPIAAEDWPTYRELRLRALTDSPQAFGSTLALESAWPERMWSARAAASATGESGIGLFAMKDGQACGLAWCLLSADTSSDAHIYQMWVAPEARGHRLGEALLETCTVWAKQHGAERLCLTVTVGESAALSLYQAKGFHPVGLPMQLREDTNLMAQDMALDLTA